MCLMLCVPAVHSCGLRFFGNFCDWEVICVFAALTFPSCGLLLRSFPELGEISNCVVTSAPFAGQTRKSKGHDPPWQTCHGLVERRAGSWGNRKFRTFLEKQSSPRLLPPLVKAGDPEVSSAVTERDADVPRGKPQLICHPRRGQAGSARPATRCPEPPTAAAPLGRRPVSGVGGRRKALGHGRPPAARHLRKGRRTAALPPPPGSACTVRAC